MDALMKRLSQLTFVCAGVFLVACQTTDHAKNCPTDHLRWVVGQNECLKIDTYGGGSGGSGKPLVVFLHGDGSNGGSSDYMELYASIVDRNGGIGVSLIRPGYYDSQGNHSTGYSYRSKGDGYRQHIVDSIADAVRRLRSFHKSSKVVLVGHSGGAAISGVILGQYPGLADAAVLAACPCNITQWRNMRNRRAWPMSKSPHNYVNDVPQNVSVTALTGAADTNTSPKLSKDYVQTLQKRGVKATFINVDGASHNGVVRSQEFTEALLGNL